MGKVLETGLLVNRQVQVCASSPDGIVELYFRNETPIKFLGLCALEIKTRNSVRTATKIDEDIVNIRGSFKECNAGSIEFENYVKEPACRSQLCQHACAMQLKFVMIAYAVPGGVIKRIVMVKFSNN